MKTLLRIIALVFATVLLSIAPQKTKAQVGVSFQVFYDGLSPYGLWVDDPSYGYVWVPDAGAGFVPYATAGHWVYTDYGWTWVSDYPWGWAPFHYGRWVYDDFYGWMWIPGDEWAPAWVSWRMCDGFYGWAPLGPGFSVGLFFGYDPIPDNDWVFVSTRYFTDPYVYRHYEPRSYNTRYVQRSSRITAVGGGGHGSYYTGPNRRNVEKITGRPVSLYSLNERSKPGQSVGRNSVSLYKPAVISRTAAGGNKPAPRKFAAYRAKASNGNAAKSNHTQGNTNRVRSSSAGRSSSPATRSRHYYSPAHTNRSAPEQHRSYSRPQPRPSSPQRRPVQRAPAYHPQPRPSSPQRRPLQRAPAYHPQPRPQPRYNMNRPQPGFHQQFNNGPQRGGGGHRMR